MAADYGAHRALSSAAVDQARDIAPQHDLSTVISSGSWKIIAETLQSLEPIQRFSHLHTYLVRCTRVSNSNRMPVSGIDPLTPSYCSGVKSCALFFP
jgi:hypothetical protein